MRTKEIALVLVRILALYVLVKGLEQFTTLFQFWYPFILGNFGGSLNLGRFFLLFSITGVVLLLVGIIIWLKSKKIVLHITDDKEMSIDENDFQYKELYSLGLTLVGVVLVVENVPALLGHILQLIQYSVSEYPSDFAKYRDQTWIVTVSVLLKLAIALVLILRSSGIYGLIKKLRELGLKKNNIEE